MMRFFTNFTPLVLVALVFARSAFANQDCDFLPLTTVTEKFPAYEPWRVTNGGSGACRFQGENRDGDTIRSVILDFTQQVHDKPGAAIDLLKELKAAWKDDNEFTAVPQLGSEAFFYRPKRGPSNMSVSWWTHRDRMVLSGMMIASGGAQISAQDREILTQLVEQTLAVSSKPAAYVKATQCPYFDADMLKQLLPGKSVKIQRFGENSCLAEGDNERIVQLTRLSDRGDQGRRTRERSSNCTSEDVAGLGGYAVIEHGCKGGNPNSSVKFIKEGNEFAITFLAGKEPTVQQRSDLIAFAKLVFAKR
jgi:hypothetical protein